MDTLTVAKFAQHRVNWITVCQCYLGHTRANVCTSCEWPISEKINKNLKSPTLFLAMSSRW